MTALMTLMLLTSAHAESFQWPNNVQAIELSNQVGDVRVQATSGPMTASVTVTKGDCTVAFTGVKRAVVLVEPVKRRGICVAEVTLSVPKTSAVQVQLGAGDITLDGLGGSFDLQLGAGDLVLDTASARIQVGAGSVTGRVSQLELELGAGDVALKQLSGDVLLSVGAGGVSLAFSQAPDLVEATVGVGALEVVLPKGTVVEMLSSGARVQVAEKVGAKTRIDGKAAVGSVHIHD